ncbi:unnamed protein product [Cunninghamella echinulata]
MAYSGRDIALFVIAFFFPPLAVLIKRGCGAISLLIFSYLCWVQVKSGGLRYEPVPQNEPTRVAYGTTNQPTDI